MKIVIADDHLLIREGLSHLLTAEGFDVAGTATDAPDLLRLVGLTRPAAAIVDIKMPPTFTDEGLAAAQQIRTRYPAVSVLVLSQYLESNYAQRLIADTPGSVGYLLKDRLANHEILVDALTRLTAGECVIDPAIVSRLLSRRRPPGTSSALTPREQQVLALIAEGRSNRAIAQRLAMSPKTLETHVRQVFQKLGIEASGDDSRRVLAVLTYLRAIG